MTLEQAHNIQRRELMSLRAENKRLKKQASGLFPSEEKESLERRIRHLEQVIATNERKHEAARSHWKLTDERCYRLEMENLDLRKQVAHLSKENGLLLSRAEKPRLRCLCSTALTKNLKRR